MGLQVMADGRERSLLASGQLRHLRQCIFSLSLVLRVRAWVVETPETFGTTLLFARYATVRSWFFLLRSSAAFIWAAIIARPAFSNNSSRVAPSTFTPISGIVASNWLPVQVTLSTSKVSVGIFCSFVKYTVHTLS